MATARKIYPKPPLPPPQPDIELRLSPEEAQFLLDLVYRVGGDPTFSRRKYADSILRELGSVNVKRADVDDRDDAAKVYNAIYFKNTYYTEIR